MSERDELLARAKSRSMDFAQGAGLKSSDMLLIRELEAALRAALAATDRLDLLYSAVAGVRDALRAALAARPQPLFEGRALALRYIASDPWVPFDPNQRVVVYEASVKSEPTCAKCGQRIHRVDGSWWHSEHDADHMARRRPSEGRAVAGSATPTQESDQAHDLIAAAVQILDEDTPSWWGPWRERAREWLAGAATPTDDELADGYPLSVAGSATPTGEGDE